MIRLGILLTVLISVPTFAQAPGFSAVVIKRNLNPENRRSGFGPGRFVMVGGTFRQIFALAWPSDSADPIGAPDWLSSERYDLTALIDGEPTQEQSVAMWRQLFSERLRLQAHYEDREEASYTLTPARRDGRLPAGMRKLSVDCNAWMAARRKGETVEVLPHPPNDADACTSKMTSNSIASGGMSLKELAFAIRNLAGRPIVVDPALSGFYEFMLTWSRPTDTTVDAPIIFTAVQEQLGLKLEPSRSTSRVVVIDHIERPSED